MREEVSVGVVSRRNGVYRDLCGVETGMASFDLR